MKELASLNEIFNKFPSQFKPGDLVLIKTKVIIKNYKFNFSSQTPSVFGLILCEDHNKNDVHPRIYYKKVYKVYLQGIILSILHTDIQEKLT